MSEADYYKTRPTLVECPTCFAWIGWACSGRGYGYHAAGYHRARITLARTIATGTGAK